MKKSNDYGVPADGLKPTRMTKGPRADYLYIIKGDHKLNEKAWEAAKESLEQGNDVLMGTPMMLDRCLFPGALVVNDYKVAGEEEKADE